MAIPQLLLFCSLISSSVVFSKPHSTFLDDARMHPRLATTKVQLANEQEKKGAFWKKQASQLIQEKIGRQLNQGVARNVIMFLGDGMSIPTVSATRVYQGGDENFQLAFEKFPYTCLSKTYCVDKQVADSACSATAYLAGIKGNYETIGVTADVVLDDCNAMVNPDNNANSIAHYSQLKGKSTGIVTTARVTDASPAGVYAHTANRDWETDSDVIAAGHDPKRCIDIAQQLIERDQAHRINVIMGGGRRRFLPNTTRDEGGQKGQRTADINLIDRWQELTAGTYVSNRSQLLSVDLSTTDHLLGLFAPAHMDYNMDRDAAQQPSLTEMTEAAIRILSRNAKGYFLFVEGALIDKAHHDSRARKSLNDTAEFSKAIERAVELTSEQDTLIVVTADHSHTMSINGYPVRGNDILGFGGVADDKVTYTTLSYSNGPGFTAVRQNATAAQLADVNYAYGSWFPRDSETHGGDDVAVYAQGPWAHLFSGVIEQNVIPHIMSYASCVGEFETACDRNGATGAPADVPGSTVTLQMSMWLLAALSLVWCTMLC